MRRRIGISLYVTAAIVAIALFWAGGLAARQATAVTAATARVAVTYVNPQNFSETREFGQYDKFNGTRYLEPLKAHLIKQGTRMLPAGLGLEVTITDIKLAGAYEPWHGPNFRYVRFMRDIYPPRIDLSFKLMDSDGKVLREGSRTLRNLGYLQSGSALPTNTDPLRYDKALLDSWLRRGPDKL